jgi:hypothetical protein
VVYKYVFFRRQDGLILSAPFQLKTLALVMTIVFTSIEVYDRENVNVPHWAQAFLEESTQQLKQ